MDWELPLGMIHVRLIFDHNMGMKYAEKPFNMGILFYLSRPLKWVHFQTPNTGTMIPLYIGINNLSNIYKTNREWSTRSSFNTRVRPDPSTGPKGTHEGRPMTQVLIPDPSIPHEVGLVFIIPSITPV